MAHSSYTWTRHRIRTLALATGVWAFALGVYGILGPHPAREYVIWLAGATAGYALAYLTRALLMERP
jgi:hypothetical protein